MASYRARPGLGRTQRLDMNVHLGSLVSRLQDLAELRFSSASR